ncbi:hypothetical protein, partial [Escherichia coli]|uniref:hypothetical protein n=1 Tax=Escherichia coli TaxID=562 RepID=UPI002157A274
SLKTSIKTITYLSDTGCLEIQGASLGDCNALLHNAPHLTHSLYTIKYTLVLRYNMPPAMEYYYLTIINTFINNCSKK